MLLIVSLATKISKMDEQKPKMDEWEKLHGEIACFGRTKDKNG